ncbi:MAG: phosphomannomutase/phosphoglucomutase [Mycobacteriales bacterium]
MVKAYDIRGLVPQQLGTENAHALGAAFARRMAVPTIAVAHDMRDSSPELSAAFAAGVSATGTDVAMVGLASTDMLYFVSGYHDMPGAMFTASHNPAAYNGIKVCTAGVGPISSESGLNQIAADARDLLTGAEVLPRCRPGQMLSLPARADYAQYLLNLVPLGDIRPLRVVVDAGNGMAGYTVPAVLTDLPTTIIPLYFELDGNFPNHEANPLEPANLVDLQRAVARHGADIGLAFDGDADRCFVIDERGEPVSPSAITALVAAAELSRHPGATVIYNLITSQAVPEVIAEHGGVGFRSRVGHSYIKAEMARTGAVFGGEHSAHYYFRSFWGADTGMLAALHVLAALGGQGSPLSQLSAQYQRYPASGEINSVVPDQPGVVAVIEDRYARESGVTIDHLDGLTVRFADRSWFNVRASNTEPLLRLNAEAVDAVRLAALRDEVLGMIRDPQSDVPPLMAATPLESAESDEPAPPLEPVETSPL